MNKKQSIFWSSFACLILFLSGCSSQETIVNNYYLSLSGDSEQWNVREYKIKITPESFHAGNGKINRKSEKESTTDFFDITVHAVIDDEDTVIQAKQVIGSETNITKNTLGFIEGGPYFDDNGEPITLENISDIYIVIEWKNKGKAIKEKVDLYNPNQFFQ